MLSVTFTSLAGSRYGSGLTSAASTKPAIATLAAMPSAIISTAIAGKARALQQLTYRETKILPEVVEEVEAARIAALFLPLLDAGHPAARLVRRHAGGDVGFDLARQVIAQLFVELVLHSSAGNERPQSQPQDVPPAHRKCLLDLRRSGR